MRGEIKKLLKEKTEKQTFRLGLIVDWRIEGKSKIGEET